MAKTTLIRRPTLLINWILIMTKTLTRGDPDLRRNVSEFGRISAPDPCFRWQEAPLHSYCIDHKSLLRALAWAGLRARASGLVLIRQSRDWKPCLVAASKMAGRSWIPMRYSSRFITYPQLLFRYTIPYRKYWWLRRGWPRRRYVSRTCWL